MNSEEKQDIILHIHTNFSELRSAESSNLLSSLLIHKDIKLESASEQEPRESNLNKRKEEEDGDTLFDVSSCAIYYGVSQNTIRAWLKKGLLPYIRIHKRIRIRKSSILALEKRRGEQI